MLAPIHPFPARMAPDIALNFLAELPHSSTVLDPMCGSGVTLRTAVERGHTVLGFDADPLAVLMTQVWTTNSPFTRLGDYAEKVANRARKIAAKGSPRSNADDETKNFIDFWFAERQQIELQALASTIANPNSHVPAYARKALKIALSRLIVTKTKGASLAWDVAHSRPHRKKATNDFDVLAEFVRASSFLCRRLSENHSSWKAKIRTGDARKIALTENSVDAIITSPPYLDAIDYMRGHRLSLVWLGYSVGELRDIRSGTVGIGTRSAHRVDSDAVVPGAPDQRAQKLIDRYVFDLGQIFREFKRVAKPNAKVCIVTANSNIRGYEVRTNTLVHAAATGAGLTITDEKIRTIEPNKRYLPTTDNAALKSRMMQEHIQYFSA